MEKESKLFDKRFVHFMWDDELEGKKVFVEDYIGDLHALVEKGNEHDLHEVRKSDDVDAPFQANDDLNFTFAYYDPNYSIKKAFNEGKTIQFLNGVEWNDVVDERQFEMCLGTYIVRVKPEEEWIVCLARADGGTYNYLYYCKKSEWESFQKDFGAKTKLFIGTKNEAVDWYESRKRFTALIKAWEDNKKIQILEGNEWLDVEVPWWRTDCEYRVKPDCPCEDGIDSKACAGCPQSEERKQTVRPFKDCDELVEFWSKNYQTGFRPAYTKPLIWVRLKVDGRERLIVAFGKGVGSDFVEIGNKAKAVTLQKLFDDYEFLDGSPVGKKEER